MKNKTKISISIFAIAIGSICISEYSSPAVGNATGVTQAAAGDPKSGGATCAKSGCHLDGTPTPVTPLTGIITSNVPVAGYTPGSTYTFSVTFNRPGHTRFGFEISPQDGSGTFLGTLIATDAVNTKLASVFISGSGMVAGKYITHANATGSGGIWSFDWTAPTAGTGDVTFYGAFNAAGGTTTGANADRLNDSIFTSTTLVSEDVASGIDESSNLDNTIAIFPNPISDKFSVSNSLNAGGSLTIRISDVRGIVVKTIQNAVAYQTIDIADLTDGVYFLRIETSEGEVIKKIVKE